MKELQGNITITRPFHVDNDFIRIELVDENSRIHFLEVKLTLNDFTKAITGQSCIPITFKAKGLQNVGKVKETLPLEFPMSDTGYTSDRKSIAENLARQHCKEGYTPDLYFGSQSSFKTVDGVTMAYTRQFRYVEK